MDAQVLKAGGCLSINLYPVDKKHEVKVLKIHKEAVLPIKGTPRSAGFDIFSSRDYIVQAECNILVQTGIAMEPPEGYYLQIAPRSGMAYRNMISVMGGIIDPDYTGEIKVILYNNSQEYFCIKKGDRIAQVIPISYCNSCEVIEVLKLNDTVRGDTGFGSTGI